jgi:tetratricopeptide (TPR) repeat protein
MIARARGCRWLALCAWLIAGFVVWFVGCRARAQEQVDPSGMVDEWLAQRPCEAEAYNLLAQGKFIQARKRAVHCVSTEPAPFVAQFVLAYIEEQSEGNLPRALFLMTEARKTFEGQFGPTPSPPAPWRWHARILMSQQELYGMLERYEEKLQTMDLFNVLYEPDMIAERAWPLMKLGRYDEARTYARMGIATGLITQTLYGYNSLCAIEFEAGNDSASYEACRKALDNSTMYRNTASTVDLSNFAEASRSVFRLAESEKYLLQATKTQVSWYSNPWLELAELYMRQGRFAETFSALKEAVVYRQRRPAHLRSTDRNEMRRSVASFLLLSGYTETARGVTSQSVLLPDRRAFNSRDPGQDKIIAALLDRLALRMTAQETMESSAGRSWLFRARSWAVAQWWRLQGWLSGRKAAKLLGENQRLAGIFRIGTAQSAIIQPWLVGDVIALTEPQVVLDALGRVRASDKRPYASAYYDAYVAEALWRRGDERAALRDVERALGALPPGESLLKARTFAVGAAAAAALGRADEVNYLERAYLIDPGVLRRLELALPLTWKGSRDGLSEQVRQALLHSPRFQDADGWGRSGRGFVAQLEHRPASARLCVRTPKGDVLGCSELQQKSSESSAAFATRLVAQFQRELFAPRLDVSQADIHSLDGTNRTGRNPLDALQEESAHPPSSRPPAAQEE